jgi:hypothetical protein
MGLKPIQLYWREHEQTTPIYKIKYYLEPKC